jgi:molybdenum cofactor biosynthesis enzyme
MQGVYFFEDVGDDLPRPSIAALRALSSAGLLISARGWGALDSAQRRAFVEAGAGPHVDVDAVRALASKVAVSEIRLMPRQADADPTRVPDVLAAALRPHVRLPDATWAALRPLDRYVLWRLANNGRLLHRALREILPADPDVGRPRAAIIAHATVTMRPDSLQKLRSPTFLDGRAFVLARVAGVRAARRAQETFDVRADRATGAIELEWSLVPHKGVLLWQAHVSAWDGTFSVAASLAAASTAAIALADMVAEEDGEVTVDDCRLVEEPWRADSESDGQDMPTAVLLSGPRSRPALATPPAAPAAAPRAPSPPAAAVALAAPAPAPSRPTAPALEAPRAPASAAPASLGEPRSSKPLLYALIGVLALILVALGAILVVLLGAKR